MLTITQRGALPSYCLWLCLVCSVSVVRAHWFPSWPNDVFYQNYSTAPIDANSTNIINTLNATGGFNTVSKGLQVDLSFHINRANCQTPRVSVAPYPNSGGYYNDECDDWSKVNFPLPAGGRAENCGTSQGYDCDPNDCDCHILVVDEDAKLVYEAYQSYVLNNVLHAMCVVVWNLTQNYPATLHASHATSADAAGFPITPLLFTADELASGVINHAIRFILPNNRIRYRMVVPPATHSGAGSLSASNPLNIACTNVYCAPYGVHLRLRSNFTGFNTLGTAAKVVARALMTYGMFLADGGNIPLTAASDAESVAKYSSLSFFTQSLASIKITDFDVIYHGPQYRYGGNTVINFPLPSQQPICPSGPVSSSSSKGVVSSSSMPRSSSSRTSSSSSKSAVSSSSLPRSSSSRASSSSAKVVSSSSGKASGSSSARASSSNGLLVGEPSSSGGSGTSGDGVIVSQASGVNSAFSVVWAAVALSLLFR